MFSGLDMIAIPGDTKDTTISGIIADEAAIGMVNQKTTAVRLIPVIGKKEWERRLNLAAFLDMPRSCRSIISPAKLFVARGGRIPAPIHSF